jgi:hypothetical protein
MSSNPDTIEGQLSFSLNRAAEFVVDRMWINIFTSVLVLLIPEQTDSLVKDIGYVLAASIGVFYLREQFLRPTWERHAENSLAYQKLMLNTTSRRGLNR